MMMIGYCQKLCQNTIFADEEGCFPYFCSKYIPVRVLEIQNVFGNDNEKTRPICPIIYRDIKHDMSLNCIKFPQL